MKTSWTNIVQPRPAHRISSSARSSNYKPFFPPVRNGGEVFCWKAGNKRSGVDFFVEQIRSVSIKDFLFHLTDCSGYTRLINGTSAINLFLRATRRRCRYEIATFNFTDSTWLVFSSSFWTACNPSLLRVKTSPSSPVLITVCRETVVRHRAFL